MRTLLLMRHGKSDWNARYGHDHDRPLNERGVSSAGVMGEVLSSKGLDPDLVISSSAVRARSTAELAKTAGSWRCAITIEPRLYGASPKQVLEVASTAPDVGRLMLVGHQPTWSLTAHLLTGSQVEVKTATVVVITTDIDRWSDFVEGCGDLVEVLNARDFLE